MNSLSGRMGKPTGRAMKGSAGGALRKNTGGLAKGGASGAGRMRGAMSATSTTKSTASSIPKRVTPKSGIANQQRLRRPVRGSMK